MNGQNRFDVNKEFFVIGSDNLNQVETRLYGFSIVDGCLVEDKNMTDDMELSSGGAYVYVKRLSDKIVITQDYVGSYGLYMYQNKDYFALSNSFLRLVDYVKKHHPITFNHDYANYFVNSGMCSAAYNDTLVSEIILLDRSAVVEIDIAKKVMNMSYIDYKENTVDIHSVEGLKLLDDWYCKWTGIIRNLASQGENIQIDLSGGFDSRLTLLLVLGSGIDMNNILVNSIDDELHTHKEDYEIASMISNHYEFALNNRKAIDGSFVYNTMEDILNISFYLKLGFHKQMYFKGSKVTPKRHYFSGGGGECVRNYWDMTEEEYIQKDLRRCGRFSVHTSKKFQQSVLNILNTTFAGIKGKYESFGRTLDSADMMLNLYRETRCRNHFGKDTVENYYAGYIKYNPLLDSGLHRLKLDDDKCKDKNLLMAVIFDRYCKTLLEFKFEGEREIVSETIEHAKEINRLFPLEQVSNENWEKRKDMVKTENVQLATSVSKNTCVPYEDVITHVKNIFCSPRVTNTFGMIYDREVYEQAVKEQKAKKFQPMESAYLVLAIAKVLQDVFAYNNIQSGTVAECMNEQLHWQDVEDASPYDMNYLEGFVTGRIDIRNVGTDDNDIDIIEISDAHAKIIRSSRHKAKGQNYFIMSKKGKLELQFQCVHPGMLHITLRGKDVRDENGKKIPFWIDYSSLRINGEECLSDIETVWVGKPYRYSMHVEDGQVVKLEAQWKPHMEKEICKEKPVMVEEVTDKKEAYKGLFARVKGKIFESDCGV